MPRLVASITFTVTLAFAAMPGAHAQERIDRLTDRDRTRSTGPSTTMGVHGPEDPEIIARDRERTEPEMGRAPVQGVPLEAPLDPKSYVCGRGDIFDLNFWGQQNFKLRVTVDPEGRAFIPKVGYVEMAGKTLEAARTTVKQAVHRYYPGLNFDLSLLQPRSFLVHVAGLVAQPGIYPATAVERVTTVLASAGEIKGSKRLIEVKRRDGTVVTADLTRYNLTGETRFNPYLNDGDVITVPGAQTIASITGAVQRPGQYELIGKKDLSELIELAGGLRSDVTRALPVRIDRRTAQDKRIELRVQLERTTPENVPVKSDDHVVVPSSTELTESVVLIGPVAGATAADEVTSAQRFPFSAGMMVSSLIQDAGHIGSSADLKRAYVRHEDSTIDKVDLERLYLRRDYSADLPLRQGDSLVIPQRRVAVSVEGSVVQPGVFQFNPAFQAEQYLALAGGPRNNASSSGSYHVISADGQVKRYGDKLPMQPGDTLLVPERTFTRGEIASLVIGTAGILLSAASIVFLIVTR